MKTFKNKANFSPGQQKAISLYQIHSKEYKEKVLLRLVNKLNQKDVNRLVITTLNVERELCKSV